MRVRLLEWADHLSHTTLDWYINAQVFGHHLPGWGVVQLWQWRLCNAYEDAVDED